MTPSVYESLIGEIPSFFTAFAMCCGLFITAPVLSKKSINRTAKVLCCLLLAIMISPFREFDSSAPLIPAILTGFVIGIYTGSIYLIALESIIFAGTTMSYSAQLGFANMVDSATGVQNSVLQRVVYYFALLIFLSVGGVEMMIVALASAPTYETIIALDVFGFIKWSGLVYLFGLFMALPIMITTMLINVGMAVITKSAPSVNVFSIGFPVVLLVTLMLLAIYTPPLMSSFIYYFFESINRSL